MAHTDTVFVSPAGSQSAPYASTETGLHSIQAALDYATTGDTVRVSAGTYAERVTLTKSVTLQGDGMSVTVLDATASGTCLALGSGVTAIVRDLQLCRGQAEYGGGIRAGAGSLTLERVWINRCRAGRGGGVYAEGSLLTMRDSAISACVASSDLGTAAGKGGGLYLISSRPAGRASITGCAFYGNRALYAGALRLWEATADLRQCQFVENRAHYAVIEMTSYTDVTIGDLLLLGNQSYSGAVQEQTETSTVVLVSGTVTANESVPGGDVLFADVYSSLELWNSAFQRNVPDTVRVNPATVLAGNVFSTPPAGFTGLTPTAAAFATGPDGDCYLAASPQTGSAFIGTGRADVPFALDPAARKCFADGTVPSLTRDVGYAYPPASAGALELSCVPAFVLLGRGRPTLTYSLEAAATADFSGTLVTTPLGPLGPDWSRLPASDPEVNQQFYRLRGTKPRGNTVTLAVTDAAAAPLADVRVDLLTVSDNVWAAAGVTDSTGTCTLPNLPDGSYTVLAGNGSQTWLPHYLGNTTAYTQATVFALTATQTSYTGSITLTRGATVTGRVLETVTGAAITAATVVVYRTDGTAVNSSTSDASGYFTVGGLPAGTFRIGAAKTPVYTEAFWTSALGTQTFTLSSAETRALSPAIRLAPYALVSGTVSLPDNGRLFAIAVVLYRAADYAEIAYAFADAQGHYALYGPPGAVVVTAGEGSDYVIGYSATLNLSVTTPQNADFTLARGGTVAGSVTDGQHVGIPNLYVDFYAGTPVTGLTLVDSATTDSVGDYLSPLLPAGTYYVQAYGEPGYNSPWYLNATYADGAMAIPVTVGSEITDVNFTVTPK